MTNRIHADCTALLIGSLPLKDHRKATDIVFEYTPSLPLWVQLTAYERERMIPQFMPGLPGVRRVEDKTFIDTSSPEFDGELVSFYEEYLAVTEGQADLETSRFAISPEDANGFSVLLEVLGKSNLPLVAVKGQVTGPFTFCTGIRDQHKNAILYNDQLKDAAVKLLAMKALWQVRKLSRFKAPVIIFCDEPALAGYGTSEFIGVDRNQVTGALGEVFGAIHSEGGLAGVHVCANTDWSLILDSPADIVSFDAYSYFDRFILYGDLLKKYVDAGKVVAWGIVPTADPQDIERETVDSLVAQFNQKMDAIEQLGIERHKMLSQSFITPSCGAGSLTPDKALKVLRMTKEVAERVKP